MSNRSISIILLISLLLIESCSFNKFFYNPVPDKTFTVYTDSNFQDFSIINKSGDTLNGILMDPGPGVRPKGTILLIHGNSGSIEIWKENALPLYTYGYRVLVFDYEGFGKSTGKPTHKNVVSDTELFLDSLYTRFGKVIIWGISLGGNLSVYVAYRNTDKVKSLVIEAGFTSHNEIARVKVPPFIKPLVLVTVRSPYKSKTIIKKLQIPVVVAHSPSDKVVPYEMGKILFENANEPKFFLQLTGDHCLGIKNNRDEYLRLFDTINHE